MILTTSPYFIPPPSGYPLSFLAATWASLAVAYPVTAYVFYLIGKHPSPGFRTGRSLFVIYFSSLLGQVLGATLLFPFGGGRLGVPYSYAFSPSTSLSLLFVAFSGFALSNLSHPDANPAERLKGTRLVPLVALAFGLDGGLVYAAFSLSMSRALSFFADEVYTLNFAIAIPVTFVVFYYLGRRFSVAGHTFRFFGLLFVGLYVGEVVGTIVSVALFGQASWVPAGPGVTSWSNGVAYTNIAPSLQLILESLNPIGSLPFLPFFAMALSRTSRPGREGEPGQTGLQAQPSADAGLPAESQW